MALVGVVGVGVEDDGVLGTILIDISFELLVAIIVFVGILIHLIELVHDGIRFGALHGGGGFVEVTVFVDGFDKVGRDIGIGE